MSEDQKTTHTSSSHKENHHTEHESKKTEHHSKTHEEKAPEIKDFDSFTEFLHFYFVKKAPSLPVGIKDVIVSISPWIAVVLLIFTIPAILILLGLSALIPFALVGGATSGFGYFATTIGAIVSLVLYMMAIPGLFSRSKQGWNYIYYSNLVSLVIGIISLQIFGALLGFAVSMYFLFQVRSYYKN